VYKVNLLTGGKAVYWSESGRGINYVGFSESMSEMVIGFATRLTVRSGNNTGCVIEWQRFSASRPQSRPAVATPQACAYGPYHSGKGGTITPSRHGGVADPVVP
jgi:hypothetical protein